MVKGCLYLNKIGFLLFIIAVPILLVTIGLKIFIFADKPSKLLQKLVQQAPDFKARTFHDRQGRVLLYRFLQPLNLDPNQKYPLIIFLNGTRERGNNNINQLKYAGQFFNRQDNRQEYPCFVAIPQCPTTKNWVVKENYFGSIPLSPRPTEPLLLTVKLVIQLQHDWNIDPKRIYIMGISSGGSGVWDLAIRYPQIFAAAVPFAGCGDVTKIDRIKKMPVWIFHGALDLAVNPHCSRLMYRALLKAGARPRYTEYKMTGHSCWLKTFKESRLLHWLFKQHRP